LSRSGAGATIAPVCQRILRGARLFRWAPAPGLVALWAVVFSGSMACGRSSLLTYSSGPSEGSAAFDAQAVMASGARLATGGSHTCWIAEDLSVKCWGGNLYGQLGDGTTEGRTTPVVVQGLTGAKSISAGQNHSCALLEDGTVKCWGANDWGQLGDGSNTSQSRPTPVPVQTLSGATAIASGFKHSCALLKDGTAKCWGMNVHGQLGNGTTYTSGQYTPVDVFALSDVLELSTHGIHACARLADGGAKCWGMNEQGQLGNGTLIENPVPVDVGDLAGIDEIATGSYHSCARLKDGTAKCWGLNDVRQLGDGTKTNRMSPVVVKSLAGAAQLAGGVGYSCARLVGGTVECWGDNSQGRLGDGTTAVRRQPTRVRGLSEVVEIAMGDDHACARLRDRTVWCWGANESGQLGNDTMTDSASPVRVLKLF
jgi:alpha-tubulin suppressor-like RCC1 family protein